MKMADNRPNVYWEGNVVVLRASSLGNCIGELTRHGAGITGEGTPEFLARAYAEGTDAEAEIMRRGRQKAGLVPLDGLRLAQYGSVGEDGQIEAELVGKGWKVRCHPDGIAECYTKPVEETRWGLKDRFVEEAKFLGPDYFNKYMTQGITAIPFYAWQLSVEMAVTGLPAVYYTALKDRKDDGTVEVGEVEVTWYMEPPFSKKVVMARAAEIAKMVKEGDIAECDVRQFPCPFYQIEGTKCHNDGTSDEDEVDDGTRVRIQHLRKQALEGDAQSLHARAELVKLFEEKGLKKVAGVSYTPAGTNKGRVNYAEMKKAGIDVDKYRGPDGVRAAYVKVEK